MRTRLSLGFHAAALAVSALVVFTAFLPVLTAGAGIVS